MKHKACEVDLEDSVTRQQRAEFEIWMQNNYPGLECVVNRASGYYIDPAINACWEIWLYRSK